MADLSLGNAIDTSSALLVALLGGAILLVRPRTRVSVALAAYGMSFGLALVIANLAPLGSPSWTGAYSALLLASCAALLVIVTNFPRPINARGRGAFSSLAVYVLGFAVSAGLEIEGHKNDPLSDWLASAAGAVVLWTLFAAGVFLARRFAHSSPEASAERRELALMTVGLVLFNALQLGGWFVRDIASPDWPFETAGLLYAGFSVALVIAWLATPEKNARVSRNVSLAIVVASLSGMAIEWTVRAGWIDGANGIYGVFRLLAVSFFAYAILRHRMLGLDVRMRWTIKRGTIAGVFIAVFFVASQIAQNVFSTQWGPLVGGITAGLLLFAISPLQRIAERVADRAIPTGAGPATEKSRGHDLYRKAVRLALHDGELTKAEEAHLASIADDLGLRHADAIALRDEVERELRFDGART